MLNHEEANAARMQFRLTKSLLSGDGGQSI